MAAPVLLPNGDFETPAGASWAAIGPVAFSYPTSGGHPGGYGVMDATVGNPWGIWVANNNGNVSLASLGLTAGQTYTFKQDMITLVAGSGHKGGIKIESWNGAASLGNSGDMYATTSSATWATYSFNYTIAAGADAIRVVPLWGENSSVGYDNILVENVPYVAPVLSPDLVHGNDFDVAGTNWAAPTGGGASVTKSLTWSGSEGNPAGSTILEVQNPAGAPADVFFTYTAGEIDFGDGPVEISFDGKLLTPLPGTAIHVLYNGNFVGAIMNEMNTSAYSKITRSFNLSQGFSGTNTLTLTFQYAMGAVLNSGGSVAIDNIRVKTKLSGPPAPPTAAIEPGMLVSWTAANPGNSYQPQASPDDSVWTDLGAAIPNNAVSSYFDNAPSAFYRVQETSPDVYDNAVLNPGFETSEFSTTPADNWVIPVMANAGASMTVGSSYGASNPHSGFKMLILEAKGPGAPAPNTEVRSDRFAVTGETNYTLSFWVSNPVKIASANPQYSIFFYDEFGAFLSNSFTPGLAAIGAAWTKVTAAVTPPANAGFMTVGWIQSASAEANVHWVTLIDDVALSVGTLITPSATTTLAASAASAVEISWPTVTGRSYQVKSSGDLVSWADFGGPVAGSGEVFSVTDLIVPPGKFYQVQEVTP